MRLHVVLTAIAFGLYFLAAFFYSPRFFLSDIQAKIHALADTLTITARVLDAPVKPVVSATAVCASGVLRVDLDWADDDNTYTYDVSREGDALVTGLTASSYRDTNVAVGTSYDYVVTAYGPMDPGSATSDAVSVTTPSECVVDLPDATVAVTAIDSVSLVGRTGVPRTSNQTPKFTGTSNIAGAIIDIVVSGERTVSVRTTANANGYWSVRVPSELTHGVYTASVTATDPTDATQAATQTLVFVTVKGDRDEQGGGMSLAPTTPIMPSTVKKPPTDTKETPTPQPPMAIPLDFSLDIVDADGEVFQGSVVASRIIITRLDEEYASEGATIHYRVVDERDRVVASLDKEWANLSGGQRIEEAVAVPQDATKGKYTLRVEIRSKKLSVGREKGFSIAEMPFLNFGGGILVTYPQFVRNVGWVAFGSLFSLLSWLLLWIREYWLYLHSLRHVLDRHLSGKGFIKKRKGVPK